MPTIKDALDIIGKLTVAEQESLKTMLLSPAFVKSLNIEDFSKGRLHGCMPALWLYPCGSQWSVALLVIVKMAHSDMYVRIVASPS